MIRTGLVQHRYKSSTTVMLSVEEIDATIVGDVLDIKIYQVNNHAGITEIAWNSLPREYQCMYDAGLPERPPACCLIACLATML